MLLITTLLLTTEITLLSRPLHSLNINLRKWMHMLGAFCYFQNCKKAINLPGLSKQNIFFYVCLILMQFLRNRVGQIDIWLVCVEIITVTMFLTYALLCRCRWLYSSERKRQQGDWNLMGCTQQNSQRMMTSSHTGISQSYQQSE